MVVKLVELTRSGKALVVMLFFRLFFGGNLAGMDQYRFNDFESALTVLLIYVLSGIFAAIIFVGQQKILTDWYNRSGRHLHNTTDSIHYCSFESGNRCRFS